MTLGEYLKFIETHVLCVEIDGVVYPAAMFNNAVRGAFYVTEKGRIYVS